ncbi:enoyl-CoA hydratase family protein [Gordonia sp. HNM0687]|uniref:Enoyl-CoA hydratase family protein n=1 Tax=Gordonia mangrovi TaxID=2665643 RepID=A0A6L7GU79_9ACTN|nr:enoyl-CoA hydratase family protein [Gordonia mangrovi]MXP23460.1 enoyl-CoA hydratase family protein [Gordonia mangrovi]UVF76644.1 enoyl-CoA hydratase family protein [Gordonia mangrovi]
MTLGERGTGFAVTSAPEEAPAALVDTVVDGAVLSLVLDSQHNRNALSRQLLRELLDGLRRADADPDVKVVLIRHRGPVFCSGADLSEASSNDDEEAPRTMVAVQRAILELDKPVVVRVDGAVRAGGIGIVGAADIAIAATTSSYALTEVRLGLTPAVISLTLLPRMRPRDAEYAFLTAEKFTGSEAAEYGLVTRAVAPEELDAEIEKVCRQLSLGHPQGLRETKRLLVADLLSRFDRSGDELTTLSARLFASDAAKDAMQQFLSKAKKTVPAHTEK